MSVSDYSHLSLSLRPPNRYDNIYNFNRLKYCDLRMLRLYGHTHEPSMLSSKINCISLFSYKICKINNTLFVRLEICTTGEMALCIILVYTRNSLYCVSYVSIPVMLSSTDSIERRDIHCHWISYATKLTWMLNLPFHEKQE